VPVLLNVLNINVLSEFDLLSLDNPETKKSILITGVSKMKLNLLNYLPITIKDQNKKSLLNNIYFIIDEIDELADSLKSDLNIVKPPEINDNNILIDRFLFHLIEAFYNNSELGLFGNNIYKSDKTHVFIKEYNDDIKLKMKNIIISTIILNKIIEFKDTYDKFDIINRILDRGELIDGIDNNIINDLKNGINYYS
jgi:hypothetical protein